jgi:hypothetical protein
LGQSDCQVESSAREALLWTSLGLDALVAALGLVLSLALNLLTAFLLEVSALHLLQLSGESFDLVLVLVDLSLVHVEFSSHCFHLRSLFL